MKLFTASLKIKISKVQDFGNVELSPVDIRLIFTRREKGAQFKHYIHNSMGESFQYYS